ncbi:MAG: glycosyltransferase family 4 protein [Verrucomicrobiota bacterium]
MSSTISTPSQAAAGIQSDQEIANLVIMVRADPIICGHSTEARNLAEAAIARGFHSAHIISYPIETLQESGLPLKPLETISAYSDGIVVHRPEQIGDYKVLDGRLGYAMSGEVVDLISELPGRSIVMDLYIVPHGQMVMNAIETLNYDSGDRDAITIGEAVGSDITNVVCNALAEGQVGAARVVLANFLRHDLPVAVSQYTKDLIVESGAQVDAVAGTRYAAELQERVEVSFPAIDTSQYTNIENNSVEVDQVLESRQLERDGYVMFLSRIAPAKGVDDLVDAYRGSELYGQKSLIICGNGPMKEAIREMTADDPHIRVLDDVSDEEKGILMHGCFAYCLPSKPRPEFTETFGIAVAEKMLAGGLGPVITTRTGGIPEATGGHCLEHEAGNTDALRDCLNQAYFMTDEERKELSERSRRFAMQFDRSAILDNLINRSLAVSKLS